MKGPEPEAGSSSDVVRDKLLAGEVPAPGNNLEMRVGGVNKR